MIAASRSLGASLWVCVGLAACGGGGDNAVPEEPVNIDYTSLRLADSRDEPLEYARSDDEILRPIRNGLRLAVAPALFALPPGIATPSVDNQTAHSSTNVQIDGVDEADSVKYDGRYIYSVRPEFVPATPTSPHLSRNVLGISRTEPLTAGVVPISNFVIEDEQSEVPQLYQLPGQAGTADYLVAVSRNYQAWLLPQVPIHALVIHPDRTTIQLLDVRDPQNVSQAWKIELDGWMKASRMKDDTLYIVSSYRPRLPDLIWPADTLEKRETNERRIRSTPARDLLPGYSENDGARRQLATTDGCLIAQQIESRDSYLDLVVIAAINMRTRRVTDVNCLSTNVNAVYVGNESLYVAGFGSRLIDNVPITILHKFAIEDGQVAYRATGAVVGTIGWSNPSYFMDEHEGDLRIVTSLAQTHHLTILRESSGRALMIVSSLPNPSRPAAIGKPGESVFAVRFMGARAYVVTFRRIDPLYVIDLQDPADPAIAGELEIPGFATYLHPLGPTESEFLFSVGQETTTGGQPRGIKVELFDVRDIANPQSIGSEVIGGMGTWSDAVNDPHALTFLKLPGSADARYRVALPIHVAETNWKYTGVHLFELAAGATPQLHFQGVIKTDEPGSSTFPTVGGPNRGVLHDESVFAVHGARIVSSLWQDVPQP
jgi:hypothetical protein